MEIKIDCECGTRYKFDIEPVNGRMPTPVKCPACGADGTLKANEQIRQGLPPAPAPTSSGPAEVSGILAPQPFAAAAPPPPPPPPPPGLRINRPSSMPGAPVGGGSYVPPPPPPPPMAPAQPPGAGKRKSVWPKILISCAVTLCLCGGIAIYKIHKLFPALQSIAEQVNKIADKSDLKNLDFEEDAVVLFIKHPSHQDVAQACEDYWKDKLHRTLTLSAETNVNYLEVVAEENGGQWELLPAHNDFIRIVGAPDWPAKEYEGLAQQLSQKFNTLVLEYSGVEDQKSDDFSYNEHFGAYEGGTRKFHALIHLKVAIGDKGGVEKTATTEGDDWATAHGFQPGTNGFKGFDLSDADKITEQLGLKMSDEPAGEPIKGYLMKQQP